MGSLIVCTYCLYQVEVKMKAMKMLGFFSETGLGKITEKIISCHVGTY